MARATVTLLIAALACTLAWTTAEYAIEGQQYSLTCTGNGDVLYWMLHGKGAAYETGRTYVQDNIEVDRNGVIHFKEVVTRHDGEHLCVTVRQSVTSGHTVKMRVRPLPPQDLWEGVYKAQFITGLIAALVCAFIFTAGCLVFRYRYREPKAVLLNGAEDEGHINPALEVAEDCHTKM